MVGWCTVLPSNMHVACKFAGSPHFPSRPIVSYALTDSPVAEPHKHWSGTVSQATDSQSSINTLIWHGRFIWIRGVMLSRVISICTLSKALIQGKMTGWHPHCRDAQYLRWSSWNIHSAALTGRSICAWPLWHVRDIILGAHLEATPEWKQHLYPCLTQAFQ